jgi:hypothetical protein
MTTPAPSRFGAATAGSKPPVVALPVPEAEPRSRRWRLLLVVLVVAAVLGALLGGRAWGDHGKHSVWALRAGLSAGATVTSADLERITVSGSAASALVPASQVITGQILSRTVPGGVGLPVDALGGTRGFPVAGVQLVGVALPDGNAPDGLHPGALVTVFALPSGQSSGSSSPASSGAVLLNGIDVAAVRVISGGEVATLLIPQAQAAQVTALSAQQRIALGLTAA